MLSQAAIGALPVRALIQAGGANDVMDSPVLTGLLLLRHNSGLYQGYLSDGKFWRRLYPFYNADFMPPFRKNIHTFLSTRKRCETVTILSLPF